MSKATRPLSNNTVLDSMGMAFIFTLLMNPYSGPAENYANTLGIVSAIIPVFVWTPQLYTTYKLKVCLLGNGGESTGNFFPLPNSGSWFTQPFDAGDPDTWLSHFSFQPGLLFFNLARKFISHPISYEECPQIRTGEWLVGLTAAISGFEQLLLVLLCTYFICKYVT